MKIAVASDHGGVSLKAEVVRYLQDKGFEVTDFGTHTQASCDYPDYALPVAKAVTGGEADRGILICGTGIGISIAANKVRGVRCALCTDSYMARMTREHNDANILAMGERVIGVGVALDIVDTFLSTAFLGGRHATRVEKIMALEG